MLSRYDPFASWPPYRTAGSSSGSTGSGSGSGMSSEERLAAAAPAQRQAMLSTAISSASTWQQLWGIVERYGQFLSANNVTHTLTQLERVVQGQQYLPEEAAQVGGANRKQAARHALRFLPLLSCSFHKLSVRCVPALVTHHLLSHPALLCPVFCHVLCPVLAD